MFFKGVLREASNLLSVPVVNYVSHSLCDAAQNYGGDYLPPIWILPGTTISVSLMSFLGGNLGRTYAKFHESSGATLICQ